jgi:hypothetical protein
MRPIEYRTDMDFRQALRCVQFRVGPLRALRPQGFALALGLRYGLVGTAAVYHLLQNAAPDEERLVLESSVAWSQVVADHLRHGAAGNLPDEADPDLADRVGRLAQLPVQSGIPLLRRECPLEVSLSVASEDFVESHRRDVRQGWGWFRAGYGERLFRELAEDSQRMAMNFYERRQYDLDEVREIALLGE